MTNRYQTFKTQMILPTLHVKCLVASNAGASVRCFADVDPRIVLGYLRKDQPGVHIQRMFFFTFFITLTKYIFVQGYQICFIFCMLSEKDVLHIQSKFHLNLMKSNK